MSLVEIEQAGDHVRTIRLNRPDALNAVSGAMADELRGAFMDVARDAETWVVIVAAAGERAFCVGADLKERAGFSIEDFYRNREQIKAMFEALRAIPQPTIAVPFGYALGGGFELVLSCDLVVAEETTEFGLPEARVGLLPAGGGTQLLARKVPLARAKEWIFTGARFGVEEAFEVGLLTDAAPMIGLDDAALSLANEICGCSPVAVHAAKASIDGGYGVDLERAILEVENAQWERVINSADREEGIAAFNEKRDARWSNR